MMTKELFLVAKGGDGDGVSFASGKRSKLDRFPLSRLELAVSLGVFLVFSSGLFCMYITMPAAEFGKLKLPRSISDLRLLGVFNATTGGMSCFFLSKLIGRPLITWLWLDKLRFFQAEIDKRRDKLLNYMLFLRITPTLPNLFIPAAYITIRAGLAIEDLKSVKDLYNFKTL